MEMTTRTQLQTHFGRLLDLASQPSPPLKPTFWDKLDLDGRRKSVDQERSWKFNNESAWDPIGPVKDEWNKFIYPGAIKPLLQDNTRIVYRNVKRQTPYSVCCWMIGKEWHSSRPAAIIICGNKRVTKNAVKLIEGHGELGRTWGFRVYGYESKISITMGTSANTNDDDSPLCAISGTCFAVGGRDSISTRMATLGGSIEIDGEYFGVTVAHPFLERPQDESSDDDESDMSDDDSEVTELISHIEETPYVTLEFDAAFVEEPKSHRIEMLGAIPNSNRPKYFSQGADWALLDLQPAALAINLITTGGKIVVPWWITRDSLSEGELWAAVSPVNPVQTKASPSICGLFIPHAGLQDVWALNMKPIPGYCGSWIVDVSSNAISGILVAGSEANNVSYALPAHVVFDEIRARFPRMRLQSLGHIVALPVSSFVEVIRKASELGFTHFVNEMVSKRSSLDKQDRSGWTPLCWAISKGYEAVVASFLAGGASSYCPGTNSGMVPLALAAQEGHVAIAKLILSAGADPDQSGHDGRTPLMYAARQGHQEITHLLIARGALVESCDVVGSTPLAEAASHGHEGVISILIASGADIHKRDIGGRTPLMRAIVSENETAATILLEQGADVNCIDVDGNTPLLLAAKSHDSAIVKLLIERGAWIDTRNNDGDTALILAVKVHKTPGYCTSTLGCDEIVRTLLEHGANPDSQDAQHNTALSLAITGGLESTVRILLDYHASMDMPNSLGQTPWSLAQQNETITHILNTDPANLDDEHGLVCPPAPSSSPVMEPNRTICNSCRARKVHCDQEKPQCYRCRRFGEMCVYPSDKTDNDKILSAVNLLHSESLRGLPPLESLSWSEPAEGKRQKEKRKFGESLRDVDESWRSLVRRT